MSEFKEYSAMRPTDTEPTRVLVTGATSGVGEHTARLFADRGARVALVGRRESELDRVGREIGAWSFAADVSNPSSATAAVNAAVYEMNGLDVVVNAAGVARQMAIEDLDPQTWRETIDTNLSGTFFVSRAAVRHMRAQGGGSIVNVASDLASMGAVGLAHYCASKAGVLGLTRAMALELAPIVRVNALCPGPIDTPMLRLGLEESDDPARALLEKEASVPLRRLAQPDEVAQAIYFLAMGATFATGTSMSLDGGTSAA